MMNTHRLLIGISVVGALSLLTVRGLDAHKGITSKYTYNDDVFPILRDKCGRCHVDGGAAPMSLMSYGVQSGAVAWAESIRENLVSEAMPPWYADPAGPAVRGGHVLSPRELDIVVTWATGGTPQGDQRKTPAPMKAHEDWSLGKPDLVLQLPQESTLGPGQMEKSMDFAIPTALGAARWVKAIDLLPGTPSLVRSATIAVEHGPVIAAWEPGSDAVVAPAGAAFKLDAGATLLAHIRYKKSYLEEQETKTDRSALGLYFADPTPSMRDIQSFTVKGSADESPATAARTFSATFGKGGRLIALYPSVDKPYATMRIDAVASSGRRTTLLRLRGIRPEWPRQYWLVNPVDLPPGVSIEVSTTPSDPDSGPLAAPVKSPLEIALDFVPL